MHPSTIEEKPDVRVLRTIGHPFTTTDCPEDEDPSI